MKQKAILTPCDVIHYNFGLVFHPGGRPRVVITVQHNGISTTAFEGIFTPMNDGGLADMNVLPIVMELYRKAYPNVVVVWNQFPRKFLDTNRDKDDIPKEIYCREDVFNVPYNDERLAKYYETFYQEIGFLLRNASAEFLETMNQNKKGFLLDLHGFRKQPAYAPSAGYDVILGTRNRGTILSHQARLSVIKVADLDYSIRDSLKQSGLSVFCPEFEPIRQRKWRETNKGDNIVPRGWIREEDPEDMCLREPPNYKDLYDGGFLIRYCSQFRRIAAAIQLEIHSSLREGAKEKTEEGSKKRSLFIDTLAGLIVKVCE